VVERFSWLLVSDFHLKQTHDTSAQSVVLRDLIRSVGDRVKNTEGPLFVIVSGDLVYNGAPEQTALTIEDSFFSAFCWRCRRHSVNFFPFPRVNRLARHRSSCKQCEDRRTRKWTTPSSSTRS
jgi:hypothetical protein